MFIICSLSRQNSFFTNHYSGAFLCKLSFFFFFFKIFKFCKLLFWSGLVGVIKVVKSWWTGGLSNKSIPARYKPSNHWEKLRCQICDNRMDGQTGAHWKKSIILVRQNLQHRPKTNLSYFAMQVMPIFKKLNWFHLLSDSSCQSVEELTRQQLMRKSRHTLVEPTYKHLSKWPSPALLERTVKIIQILSYKPPVFFWSWGASLQNVEI